MVTTLPLQGSEGYGQFWGTRSGSGLVLGSGDRLAVAKRTPRMISARRSEPFSRRQWRSADSASLKTRASAVARDRHPLGLVGRQAHGRERALDWIRLSSARPGIRRRRAGRRGPLPGNLRPCRTSPRTWRGSNRTPPRHRPGSRLRRSPGGRPLAFGCTDFGR
jgi:hypothetical protein